MNKNVSFSIKIKTLCSRVIIKSSLAAKKKKKTLCQANLPHSGRKLISCLQGYNVKNKLGKTLCRL